MEIDASASTACGSGPQYGETRQAAAQAAYLLLRAEEYGKDADLIRSMIERAAIGQKGDRQEPVGHIG